HRLLVHVQTGTTRIHHFHDFLPTGVASVGTSIGNSIKRAPDREGHWHNQGCSKCPRSNSFSGSEHHDDDRGTRPSRIGSRPVSKTIGMVVVVAFAASAAGVVIATIAVT